MKPTMISRVASSHHPSDSSEQRRAEFKILKKVRKALKLQAPLTPEKMQLGGTKVQVDGVSRSKGKVKALVEVYAHQGRMKGSQPHKLMADAIKLSALRLRETPRPRAILAVSHEVKDQLEQSWRWEALAAHHVEVQPVNLSAADVRKLETTQGEQYR